MSETTNVLTVQKFKILNEFGIKPSTNHLAAGYDFYIPNITKPIEECDSILEAFSTSYNKSIQELKNLINDLYLQISAVYGEEKIVGQEMNILHLYLALDSTTKTVDDPIEFFVDNTLVFDKNGNPGIKPRVLDHIKINSGIRTCLPTGSAGIFFNKSGKGVKGWDVRACVVDEDYTGFVHLSLAYTKINDSDGIIYVGDKITQMVVIPVYHMDVEEVDTESYGQLMSDSTRGNAGFGSSDEKH